MKAGWRRAGGGPATGAVALCLVGVAASLLAVGLVSDTLARHLVQMAPVLFSLALVVGRPLYGAWVAIPVLAVWLAVMVAIWLYLAGVSDIAAGTYSVAEGALTIAIAALSASGMISGVLAGRNLPAGGRFAAGFGGLALQVGVLVLSLTFFE